MIAWEDGIEFHEAGIEQIGEHTILDVHAADFISKALLIARDQDTYLSLGNKEMGPDEDVISRMVALIDGRSKSVLILDGEIPAVLGMLKSTSDATKDGRMKSRLYTLPPNILPFLIESFEDYEQQRQIYSDAERLNLT